MAEVGICPPEHARYVDNCFMFTEDPKVVVVIRLRDTSVSGLADESELSKLFAAAAAAADDDEDDGVATASGGHDDDSAI